MGKKSISIKEGNEGKFGAFAWSVGMSVQEAARHVLANKDRYSGARVKQANFARNAAKWKKQDGGVVRSDDRWRMTDDSAAPIVDGVAPGGLLLQKRFIDDAMARMERSNFSGVVPSARMPTQAEIIEAQRKDAVKKEQAKALAAYQQQHATDFKKLVPRPQPVDNLTPDMGQQRFFEQYLNNAGSIPFSQGQVRDEDQQFQEALRLSRDARKDAELARRAKAIETADEVKKIDFFSPSKWTRENLAKAAQGLGERGRIFTDDVDGSLNWFDEHLNPLMQIGKWAKKMGEAPLDAQRTNSIVPYLTAIGTPLLYRAIGSRPFEATIPFARNALAAQTFNDHLRNIWQHGVVDSGKDVATDWVVDHAQAAIDKGLEGKRMGGENGEWRMGNGEMRDNSQFSIFNSQFSTGGYKADSPDRFRAFNVIPSGQITMQGVPHPVMGVDNLGYRQLMMPGAEYRFPGQTVLEVPISSEQGGVSSRRYQQGGAVIPPVDETQAQKDWLQSYVQSPGYTKRLQQEFGRQDVAAEQDARLQNLQNVPVKYSRDLGSWMQGAYMPREYKGMMFKQGWQPAAPQPDPIFGIEAPGTLYLGRQFRPGQVPQAKFATTPVHEFSHVVDDGGFRIPNKTIDKINDYTSKGDAPDWTQYNGRSFGYLNDPSEVIGRLQSVRYLLNKSNIHDARTEVFDDAAFDKMMNDPTIQGNSDFQELLQTLKGNDMEKKQRFIDLMNTVASRSNGEGSTMARYGGRIERETERVRGRYQDGGALTYQAPEGYAPSTPEQRANWNQFLNYMESQGIAGSADLDARDKRLGLQYLNTYNKAYPKAQVQESFIPTAQYENYLIRRENRFPTMTKEQSEMAFNGLSPAYKQYPLSGVDNWLGRFTSKQFYPTFRSGTAIHKADGTEQVDSYNFGENFEDYVQSKGDPNVAKKYLVKQPAPMAVRQLGGGVKTKRETERERGRYQVGGGYDPTGFLGAGNINPFNANPYFTPTYAVPVAPAAAPGVAAGAPGMAGPIPGFQNFMQQNQVLSKSNPFATDIGPGDSEFDITKMGPIPGFREFMKKKTILSKDNQNPFGVNAPFADPKPTKPTTETSWGPNIGAAGAVVSGMSLLNRALESGDRNRYIGQQRIRNLGDNKGPYLSGNLGYVRGDYSLNEGDFRPDRKVPIQFGVAQMGGSIFSEPDVNVPVMEAPGMTERGGNGEWGMENGELGMENGRGNRGMENGERVNPNQAAQSAFDYYIDHRGLAPHIAAGIVGNLYQESGLQPDVKEKGNTGNGRGIAQWDVRDRWKSLHKWAEKNQRDPYDLYTQLDYILDEPGEGAKVLKALEKAQTPEEAAKIFGRVYERPSEKYANWGVRTGVARSLYAGSYSGSGGADNAGADNAGPNNAGQEYREGGEYEVSAEEVRRILREGGEVEYL